MEIQQLLQLTIDRKASDLHIVLGSPPNLRIDGKLVPVPNEAVVSPQDAERLIKPILSAEQLERLTVNRELDFSIAFTGGSRFRVNAYYVKGAMAAAFRLIPLKIPTIEDLKLPQICHNFTNLRQGLVLVTGPTGHGKSTTLAAILNEINRTKPVHILTIEDPIEFAFQPDKAIVSQREMREDTHSWEVALRSALREDPDVVLVGEMRDFETIAAALTIAETGHLVFATLHTNSAAQTIDRIVDVFPEEQQGQVKLQLSNVLEAVFSQRLIPLIAGGRTAAYEILTATPAVRTVIRDGKTHQIDNIIQTSAEFGMTTIETVLANYVKQGLISLETAKSFAIRPEELNRLVTGSSA
ncbi:MAG: type IV pilus twitching motility protein PilT [Candidatus Blackburnbacteria bacterium]|nr:type IV pilus twitching motility protein PilT [Candidatus Blackburnbacteria bacterium]